MQKSGSFLKNKWAISLAVLIAIGVSLVFAAVVFAQDSSPTDDDVNKIAKKLFCPVCENTPLDVCPTEACRQWREQIREMLTEGKTEAEIIEYFRLTYGERASGDPSNKVAAYLLPVSVILLGTFLLFRALQLWKKPLVTAPADPKGEAKPFVEGDEYVARVEEELRKRK